MSGRQLFNLPHSPVFTPRLRRKNETTPKSENTPTPKKQSKSTPKTNGASEDATVGTPTVSRQDKLQHGAGDSKAPNTPDLLSAAEKVETKKGKAEDADMQDTPELSKSALKKKQKKEQREKNRVKRHELLKAEEPVPAKKGKTESWVTSPTQGGWFLPTDPVFSPDEKYLILANLKSLRIYATESSLLANTIPVGDGGVLTAYALSSTKPNQVYIADSTNQIALWDWVSGKNIARWFPRATVQHMAVITKPESDEELLFCVDGAPGGGKDINVRALRITSKNEDKHMLKQILETGSTIRGIQVLLQSKYVVVASDDSITVGKRVKVSKTELQDFEYVWREFKFAKRITTFNAYHREPLETGKGKKAQDQRDVIDIAVGDDTGVILLFEDILASFAAIEKGKKDKVDTAEGLRPKRLHWHRDAVGAVKWSLDGKHQWPFSTALANITKVITLSLVVTKPSLPSGNLPLDCHNTYPIFRLLSKMSWSLLPAQHTPCRWLTTPSSSFQRPNSKPRRISLASNRDESISNKCQRNLSRTRSILIYSTLCRWP
jgi:NET1-associated nuclear protein 1 (U3 small nucleolar RNA-associated protein 17)